MPFYSIVYGAAVHMIDLLVWLVDDRPIEVQGYGNNIATRGSRFRFHDFVSLLLRFDSGMVAKISASGGCIYPHFHAVTVYGTAQTFVNDLKGARLIRNCDPRSKPEEIPEGYSGEQKHGVIDSFIDDILDGSAQAMVSTEDVFATMSICLAAEEAVKTGRAVKIEYI
jgi:predicted dehydrogenase